MLIAKFGLLLSGDPCELCVAAVESSKQLHHRDTENTRGCIRELRRCLPAGLAIAAATAAAVAAAAAAITTVTTAAATTTATAEPPSHDHHHRRDFRGVWLR